MTPTPTPYPYVRLAKTPSAGTITGGTTFDWTIQLRNIGGAGNRDVVDPATVVDTLPPGFAFVSGSSSAVVAGGGQMDCSIASTTAGFDGDGNQVVTITMGSTFTMKNNGTCSVTFTVRAPINPSESNPIKNDDVEFNYAVEGEPSQTTTMFHALITATPGVMGDVNVVTPTRSPTATRTATLTATATPTFTPCPTATDQSGEDREGCNYSGTSLNGVEFLNSDLDGSTFEDSDLNSVKFNDASVRDVNFDGTTMNGVEFLEADITGSTFVGADLNSVKFNDAIAQNTDFSNTTMNGTEFERADLTGSTFAGSTMTSTKFNDATLVNADFSGTTHTTGVEIQRADLTGANFSGSNMSGTKFNESTAPGADFSSSTLNGVEMQDADLTNTSFSGSSLTNVKFNNSDLTGADFRGATFSGNEFSGTTCNNVYVRSTASPGTVNNGTGRYYKLTTSTAEDLTARWSQSTGDDFRIIIYSGTPTWATAAGSFPSGSTLSGTGTTVPTGTIVADSGQSSASSITATYLSAPAGSYTILFWSPNTANNNDVGTTSASVDYRRNSCPP